MAVNHAHWSKEQRDRPDIALLHGDGIEFLHRKAWLFQKHRVRNEVRKSELRTSMAYFIHPDLGTIVHCLHDTNKYPPVDGNEYIHSRTREVYVWQKPTSHAWIQWCFFLSQKHQADSRKIAKKRKEKRNCWENKIEQQTNFSFDDFIGKKHAGNSLICLCKSETDP